MQRGSERSRSEKKTYEVNGKIILEYIKERKDEGERLSGMKCVGVHERCRH